jgi:DNA-directed RNA polymerase omega subunit
MLAINNSSSDVPNVIESKDQWPGIDSSFRLIAVAALRSKQLVRGSLPRIEANPLRRRNTSIALEEVKRGLVPFTLKNPKAETSSNGKE